MGRVRTVANSGVREQHVAVFGPSGSGKTVLVSSFFGAAQEQAFLKKSLFRIVAQDTGQGNRLRQNYLGMKNSCLAPQQTRFVATSYTFALKSTAPRATQGARPPAFDELRLVWHDYPGEWFEEEPSSAEEARRRVDAFRGLLRSDVAVILVDGQKLLDHVGEEEKYLKSMLWGLRDGLLRLKDGLLDDGAPLVRFPRIWILALSKADLHPDLDVHGFQDLVIEKAAGDIASLHDALREMVEVPEALSLGEDFMLLSSARFEPGRIEVTERVGLDLILPVACLLPLERLEQWKARLDVPRKLAGQLVDNADAIAPLLVGAVPFVARVPKVGRGLARVLPVVAAAVRKGAPKVKEMNEQARAEGDHLRAVVTQLRLDLDQGVQDGLIVTSPR